MKYIEPKTSIADKKGLYFSSFIIKDITVPIWMKSLTHIGIFVGVVAIKHVQSMCIVREMRGHPIQNDTNPFLMKSIDKSHEPLRISETRCGSIITCNLIPPAAIKRVFCNGHELYVRKAHFFYIRYQSFSYLIVSIVFMFIAGLWSLPA